MPDSSPDLPLFRCERRSCSLTSAACAKLWEAAQRSRPEPWNGLWRCRRCPIGAANAGKPLSSSAILVEALRSACPRCLRTTPRLINGRLCISCYNRDREVFRGRNAKGGVPRLAAQLRTIDVAVAVGAEVRVEQLERVTGAVEVMMLVMKHVSGPIAFGRPGVAL